MNTSLRLVNSVLRHDLLNDFGFIKGAIEVLDFEDNAVDEEETKWRKMVQNTAEKGIKLIRSMKDLEILLSSHEQNLEPLNPKEIIEEVISAYKNIPIKIVAESNVKVLANKALSSVIDNLVRNASIHSETDRIEIKIKDSNNGGYCELQIADFGIGIPDELKTKIFEPGVAYGKNAQTGLGLFIVKSIVKGYGGKVFVEDNKPRGSVFNVQLTKETNA